VELFTGEDGLDAGTPGWEHMPLPGCRPPPRPVDHASGVGAVEGVESGVGTVGVGIVAPALAPALYTAVVRSVLLPWGTQAPGETHALRAAAASVGRCRLTALGFSA